MKGSLPLTNVAEQQVFVMLRVQDAGTHLTAQSRILILDTCLTQQAGVVPMSACSCSTLDTYTAVLRSKEQSVTESRFASLLHATLNFNNDFMCAQLLERRLPIDQKCYASGNTSMASTQKDRVARMCVGCVPSMLSQAVSQSVKTFQHLLLWPHPTTAENVFVWAVNKLPE